MSAQVVKAAHHAVLCPNDQSLLADAVDDDLWRKSMAIAAYLL